MRTENASYDLLKHNPTHLLIKRILWNNSMRLYREGYVRNSICTPIVRDM